MSTTNVKAMQYQRMYHERMNYENRNAQTGTSPFFSLLFALPFDRIELITLQSCFAACQWPFSWEFRTF